MVQPDARVNQICRMHMAGGSSEVERSQGCARSVGSIPALPDKTRRPRYAYGIYGRLESGHHL